MVDKLQGAAVGWWNTPIPIYAKLHRATTLPDNSIQPVSGIRVRNDGAQSCKYGYTSRWHSLPHGCCYTASDKLLHI